MCATSRDIRTRILRKSGLISLEFLADFAVLIFFLKPKSLVHAQNTNQSVETAYASKACLVLYSWKSAQRA